MFTQVALRRNAAVGESCMRCERAASRGRNGTRRRVRNGFRYKIYDRRFENAAVFKTLQRFFVLSTRLFDILQLSDICTLQSCASAAKLTNILDASHRLDLWLRACETGCLSCIAEKKLAALSGSIFSQIHNTGWYSG